MGAGNVCGGRNRKRGKQNLQGDQAGSTGGLRGAGGVHRGVAGIWEGSGGSQGLWDSSHHLLRPGTIFSFLNPLPHPPDEQCPHPTRLPPPPRTTLTYLLNSWHWQTLVKLTLEVACGMGGLVGLGWGAVGLQG